MLRHEIFNWNVRFGLLLLGNYIEYWNWNFALALINLNKLLLFAKIINMSLFQGKILKKKIEKSSMMTYLLSILLPPCYLLGKGGYVFGSVG